MKSDSVYIVTGGSHGIGRAVASAISERNLDVIAVARSDDALSSLAKESANVIPVVADLTTSTGIESVVKSVAENFEGASKVAGIVHSAGSLIPLEPFGEIDGNSLTEHFRIHVSAPIELYRAIRKSRSIDRMLFVDSYSANAARHGWGAYSIIKSAAQMAYRCAAQELGDTKAIRVYPGAVRTRIVEMVMASKTKTAEAFGEMLKRDEFAEPEEVAKFLVRLLIDTSDEELDSQECWDYNESKI